MSLMYKMFHQVIFTIVSTSPSSQILHTSWIYVFCDRFAAVGSQTEVSYCLCRPPSHNWCNSRKQLFFFAWNHTKPVLWFFQVCCDNKRNARTPHIPWMTPEHLTSIGAFLFCSQIFWLWLLWALFTNTWHQHIGLPGRHNPIQSPIVFGPRDGISLSVKNKNVFVSQYLCRSGWLHKKLCKKCSRTNLEDRRYWLLPVRILNLHNKWLSGCCTATTKKTQFTTTKT